MESQNEREAAHRVSKPLQPFETDSRSSLPEDLKSNGDGDGSGSAEGKENGIQSEKKESLKKENEKGSIQSKTELKTEKEEAERLEAGAAGGEEKLGDSLPCAVIQDLLPVYADGLASEPSQQIVEGHLAHCTDCRTLYEEMQKPPSLSTEDAHMISALGSIRKKGRRKTIALWILGVLGILLGFRYSVLLYQGAIVPRSLMNVKVNVDSDTRMDVEVSAAVPDYGLLWGSAKEKGGRMMLRVLGGSGLLDQKDTLDIPIAAGEPVQEIYCNDSLIWQKGLMIDPAMDQLFSLTPGWAGDVSRIGQLMNLLEIAQKPHGFQLSINTDNEESCIWTFWPEKVDASVKARLEKERARLLRGAMMALFVTPNLGGVRFEIPETSSARKKTDDVPGDDQEEGNNEGPAEKAENEDPGPDRQKENVLLEVTRQDLQEWLKTEGLSSEASCPADLQNIWNHLQDLDETFFSTLQ